MYIRYDYLYTISITGNIIYPPIQYLYIIKNVRKIVVLHIILLLSK